MRALTASEIIQLWEVAYRLHPIDRALCLLQPVMPEHDRDALAAQSLGQRNMLLLALRRATFGDALPGRDHCPHCGESVEFELSCMALGSDVAEPRPRQLERRGYTVTIRPLDSFDLAAAAGEATLQGARDVLLQRSVSEARHDDEPVAVDLLPAGLKESVSTLALAADPQAEIILDLACPECRHRWQGLFDIAHVLWLEIGRRAQRLLMEVHQLARAYGWTEDEILVLSPARRASYLQMVAT